MTIPWREEAVVIRLPKQGGEREQVYFGQLWQVVEWLREHPERERLTVWLPERRARPIRFDPDEIRGLLLMVDRPHRSLGFG